jgi:flagellar biosynthesis chaperone FliJ
MSRKPLSVLLALRQRAVEQARLAVAACLRAEHDAAERLAALDDAERRGRQAASAADEHLSFLDMTARSRDLGRSKRSSLAVRCAAAENRTTDARARLATERTSTEAVALLISERLAAEGEQAAKLEQHALDDIARESRARDRRP